MTRPGWTWVRGLGNSLPSKISLLIPILGFLIIQDQKIVGWLQSGLDLRALHADSEANIIMLRMLESALKLKIFFLYFGALFFGLASTIYQIRCPSIVKQFQDADIYFKDRAVSTTRRDLLEMTRDLDLAGSYPQRSSAIDIELARSSILPDGEEASNSSAVKIDLMKSYYQFYDTHRVFSISITLALYLAAIALFAVPSLATAIKVILIFCWQVSAGL